MVRPRRVRGVQSEIQDAARRLRSEMTLAEKVLWQELRGQRLESVRFRRQHPVGKFVLDFYASSLHLVIEVDGASHATQEEHDAERTAHLEAHGYYILRFSNEAVLADLPGVLQTIRETIHSRKAQSRLTSLSEE